MKEQQIENQSDGSFKRLFHCLCNCFSPTQAQDVNPQNSGPQFTQNQQNQNPIHNELNNVALGLQGPLGKNQQNNADQPFNGNIDIKNQFPSLACKFFLKQKAQNIVQMNLLQQLESLLKVRKKFEDDSNPSPSMGNYVSATQIFNQFFFLFDGNYSAAGEGRRELGQLIQPKDVRQGDTGDCYLLGAIASVAYSCPQLIFQNFLFSENDAGFYAMKFFVDGEWHYVNTDDRFPCINRTPIYVKPNGNQIWMMVLQKCWAKIFGSYKALHSGWIRQGLIALTGIPTSQIQVNSKSPNQLWRNLAQAFHTPNRKSVVSAACGDSQLKDMASQNRIGLVPRHAYSVLDLHQIDNQMVLKMRNPWGTFTWKGDWSFDSNKWTERTRKMYNYFNNPNDGTFFMPFNQFLNHFIYFSICSIIPSNQLSICKLSEGQLMGPISLCIQITRDGLYTFSIYQPDKKRQPPGYTYSIVSLDFISPTPTLVQNCNENCVSFSADLYSRIYKLKLYIKWNRNPYPIVLNSYGPGQVIFNKGMQPYGNY